ncbi:DUF3352 domain-containing protein [Marinilabilia rubra]|uniref:DUF3352 domain-containing protein n=1 Tax=Marinilabilia rubra TaxID=2162893 RepID=A0A2U2B8T5_9BACT|nr:DUF3352 domain-containing protein [Marinilabilia rubra]PWD99475.1 DUF3352 domain-containing protein [Marinilabilia rubra]
MSKRNLGILGIILVFTFIISAVLWNLYRHQSFQSNNSIDAVPANASVIIKINSPSNLLNILNEDIKFRSELESFQSIKSIFQVSETTDSTLFFTEGAGRSLDECPTVIAFSKLGKESIEWSIHIALKNKGQENEINSWLENNSTQKRNYTGFTIFQTKESASAGKSYFSTLQNGTLTLSKSPLLVEGSIRQQQSGRSVYEDPTFTKLEKTTSKRADGSVFIKFSKLDEFSEPFLASEAKKFAQFMRKIADWGVLDFEISDDELILNGFLSTESNSSFISVFNGVEPRKPTIQEILPLNIRLFAGYNFSDKQGFLDNFTNYILRKDNHSKIESLDQQYENRTGTSFLKAFGNIIDGEMALAYSNFNASNPNQGRFLVFRTEGQTTTLPVLKQMQEFYGVNRSPITNYRVDESTSFPIYRGFDSQLATLVWGSIFPDVPTQYFSFYRNYLVFADSQKSLQSFLYDNVLNKTLDSHAYYSSFRENFSYEENFFLFAEIPHLFPYIENELNPAIFHPTGEQKKVLFNFYATGLQISNSSGLNYTTLYGNYAPHRDKEPRTIWQSRIDTMVAMKPALVDNHYTHEKEILVQDEAHNLYLINNMGRILWKKPLDGKILSEIHQIDFYKNNKYQYLFNTGKKLYLLDRNGNHVAKYPFTLPSEAANGLAVFDYNDNRNYRVFLALKDRKVYLFDKSGARVPGWNIPQTEGLVSQPVQFFRTSGRDYIVFSDAYRNYIMDRRGNHRVMPGKSFERNNLSPFFLEHPDSEKSAIVSSTSGGQVAKIMLPSGKTTIKEIEENTSNNHFFLLLHENDPEYVLVSPEKLLILNSEYEPKVEETLEQRVEPVADLYKFSSSDHKIGLVSEDNSVIYLYNSDGSLYKGFPLKGTSRFSIGFLKSSAYRFNLITGGENNYIYNYRVE